MLEPYLGGEFNAEKFMTSWGLWSKACGWTNKNVSRLLLEGLMLLPFKQATQVTLAVQRQDKVFQLVDSLSRREHLSQPLKKASKVILSCH